MNVIKKKQRPEGGLCRANNALHEIRLPQPHTPEEEKIVEILSAPIETDDNYKKLAELADNDE